MVNDPFTFKAIFDVADLFPLPEDLDDLLRLSAESGSSVDSLHKTFLSFHLR